MSVAAVMTSAEMEGLAGERATEGAEVRAPTLARGGEVHPQRARRPRQAEAAVLQRPLVSVRAAAAS